MFLYVQEITYLSIVYIESQISFFSPFEGYIVCSI